MKIYQLCRKGGDALGYGYFATIDGAKRAAQAESHIEIVWCTDVAIANHRGFYAEMGVVSFQQSSYGNYFPYYIQEHEVLP